MINWREQYSLATSDDTLSLWLPVLAKFLLSQLLWCHAVDQCCLKNSPRNCGTCHMASIFLPLSRTATTAGCSSSSLLMVTFMQHLPSHPASVSLLTTSSPLPSPLAVTSHQDQKGLMPLLAVLLVSICDAFLTTYALLPSHLCEDSHHEYFKLSHTHQIILKLWRFLLQKWSFGYELH